MKTKARRVKVRGKKKPSKLPKKSRSLELPEVELSTELSRPSRKMEDYIWWLYGEPGVGKTTTSAQFPGIHLFMCDVGGAKGLEAHWKPVSSWLEFLAYRDAYVKSDFQWASIDCVEDLWLLCLQHYLEMYSVESLNDMEDFGKTWGDAYNEFIETVLSMKLPGRGLLLLSHANQKPFKSITGKEWDQIRPMLRDQVLERLKAKIDILGYIHNEGEYAVLQVRPDDSVMAKCRPTKNFRYLDGTRIKEIRLGSSEEEAFKNISLAFRNKSKRKQKKLKKD